MQTDNVTATDTETNEASDPRAAALADYLGEAPADIEPGYQQEEFECGRASYLVLTDKEADERARESILESLWAFNTDFLSSYIEELDDADAREAFDSMRAKMCEGANALVRRMLADRLEECIADAICADGRGHFLAGYDHEEIEHRHSGVTWYIYRTN